MALANSIDVFAGRPYALVQLVCTAWAHGFTLTGPYVTATRGYMAVIRKGENTPLLAPTFWAKSEEECCIKALAWLGVNGFPTVTPPLPPVTM
jgi:hypothetical protein